MKVERLIAPRALRRLMLEGELGVCGCPFVTVLAHRGPHHRTRRFEHRLVGLRERIDANLVQGAGPPLPRTDFTQQDCRPGHRDDQRWMREQHVVAELVQPSPHGGDLPLPYMPRPNSATSPLARSYSLAWIQWSTA